MPTSSGHRIEGSVELPTATVAMEFASTGNMTPDGEGVGNLGSAGSVGNGRGGTEAKAAATSLDDDTAANVVAEKVTIIPRQDTTRGTEMGAPVTDGDTKPSDAGGLIVPADSFPVVAGVGTNGPSVSGTKLSLGRGPGVGKGEGVK